MTRSHHLYPNESPMPNSSCVADLDIIHPANMVIRKALTSIRLLTTKKSMMRKMVDPSNQGIKSNGVKSDHML